MKNLIRARWVSALLLLACFAFELMPAQAAALTTAQYQTFKAAIQADSNVSADVASGNFTNVAAYYNAANTQNPVQNVWKPRIMVIELNAQIVWSDFIALTVAKQNAYFAMTQAGFVDATSANIRTGFGAVFAGASLTNLTAIAKRVATRFEMLFATPATVSPDNTSTVFGFTVSPEDVRIALGS